MAQWYAVIDKTNGRAVSFGTEVAQKLPAEMEAITIDHQPGAGERWDPAMRSVVATAPDPLVARRARLAELRAKGWAALTLAEQDEARELAFDTGGSPP